MDHTLIVFFVTPAGFKPESSVILKKIRQWIPAKGMPE